MKKKDLFKNKGQMIIYTILFIICIGLFIYIGNIDYSKNKESDAEIISGLYDLVPKDNMYLIADANDVVHILNGQSGIILFGFPTNKWTNYSALYLYEIAKELNITKIYYYDFLNDRDNNNGTYETIVTKLEEYVPTFDNNKQNIQAPTILIVKKGEVLAYIDDTSIIKGVQNPQDYYVENNKEAFKNKIKQALLEYAY